MLSIMKNRSFPFVDKCLAESQPNRPKLTWLLSHQRFFVAIALYGDGDIAGDANQRSFPRRAQIDFLFGVDVVPGGCGAVDLTAGCGDGRGVCADLKEEIYAENPLEHHSCVLLSLLLRSRRMSSWSFMRQRSVTIKERYCTILSIMVLQFACCK